MKAWMMVGLVLAFIQMGCESQQGHEKMRKEIEQIAHQEENVSNRSSDTGSE